METIKAEINLYKYDELSKKSKEKAFNDHFDFLCTHPDDYEDEKGNIKYFTEEDYTEEVVEESIRINEYWFFECGGMAECVTYTGEHEKAGITEFTFKNKVYTI